MKRFNVANAIKWTTQGMMERFFGIASTVVSIQTLIFV